MTSCFARRGGPGPHVLAKEGPAGGDGRFSRGDHSPVLVLIVVILVGIIDVVRHRVLRLRDNGGDNTGFRNGFVRALRPDDSRRAPREATLDRVRACVRCLII